MNIGLAQINSTVGDLAGNTGLILAAYRDLVGQGAELVITPELALTGYPPQDLLFVSGFVERNRQQLAQLQEEVGSVPLIVGFVDRNQTGEGKPFFNAAAVLQKNKPMLIAHKRLLPTYDVFDEARYFEPGKEVSLFEVQGKKIGITICEDLWTPAYLPQALYRCDPLQELMASGAEMIVNLSASPFHIGKPGQREKMLREQAKRFHVSIVYCNAVGANDQLIFDGNSLVMEAGGNAVQRLSSCREENKVIDLSSTFNLNRREATFRDVELEELYDALVLGVRDYLYKCGFKKALLGLSGGIDSALVATLAVAALGADSVTGVLMPGPYSSQGSIDDARDLANNLGMTTLHLPITTSYEGMLRALQEPFAGYSADITEENLQSRLRGVTLMALSNKLGSMVLTTGNKSEMAVGYCTLYGDMCGGLAVIADVPKTIVYELSHWINRQREIIPRATLEKDPSAELRPNQKDQDSLPPYEILDAILRLAVEEHRSIAEIVALGFEEKTARWIVTQVYRSEYKRQQAAPGLKVTGRAFGVGRRFPIAQRYQES
ncbi:MAG: NAD+ synthase [Verrucomicrobiae bacterium]|nr:NAD+ synthase [Verrucomicrobiae bacterium]